MMDFDKLEERLKEYTEDLYDKNKKLKQKDIQLETNTEDVKGPLIPFSEFKAALSELKDDKAKGKTGIPAEKH